MMAPLVLSVARSLVKIEQRESGGAIPGSCRFCCVAAKRQEPLFFDADGACPFCQMVKRLDRVSDQDAMLIWLPEFTQAALNAMIHECHRRLEAQGLMEWTSGGRSGIGAAFIPPEAREALIALGAFRARADEVVARLGSASPKILAQALARVSPQIYADRARKLHGVRLLPLGARDGRFAEF